LFRPTRADPPQGRRDGARVQEAKPREGEEKQRHARTVRVLRAADNAELAAKHLLCIRILETDARVLIRAVNGKRG
jgi:hypothetical protein